MASKSKSESKSENNNEITTDDIFNLTDAYLSKEDYNNYLTHIDYEALWGFSIELAAKWEPQSLIAFDRSVIHSSCHFANKELQNKLFLTIVTEQP